MSEIVLAGDGPTVREIASRCAAGGGRTWSIGFGGYSGLGDDHQVEIINDPASVPEQGIVIEDGGVPVGDRLEQVAGLATKLAETVVLGVCTQAEQVTDLASTLVSPGRVVGLHLSFASPQPQLIEVIPGMATRVDAVATMVEALGGLALDVVVAPDRPGFLLDALLLPYLNQALNALDDHLASAKDIDTAVHLGLGYPVGPLALLDRLGLDRHLALTQAIHDATGDGRYAAPPLLRAMVAAGWTGEKAGRGLATGGEQDE